MRVQLCLVYLVVAAEKDYDRHEFGRISLVHGAIFRHVGHCLHLLSLFHFEECRHVFNRLLPGSMNQLRLSIAAHRQVLDWRKLRSRLLHVGCIVALGAARDEILTRLCIDHEFL